MNFSRLGMTIAFTAATTTVLSACGGEPQEEAVPDVEAPSPAVMIVAPSNDQTFEGSFTLRLETRGVELRPAGTVEPGTGHHHLFIDRDITPVGEPIPTEDGVIHLGMAQTEYVVEDLSPGEHTIIAVLGDHIHVRLPDVATDTVRVTISGT